MPWLSGFAGADNFAKMGSDPRFWNSLALTAVYTASTVVLQVALGLSLALLVLQIPKGQRLLRIAAILPIVLAPVVVGLFWRTLVLAPDVGLVDMAAEYDAWAKRCGVLDRAKVVALMQGQGVTRAFWEKDEV